MKAPGAHEELHKSKSTIDGQAHQHGDVHLDGNDNGRIKLQPKRQRERRQKPTAANTDTRPGHDFSDPNTTGGVRFHHSTVEDYCPCGTGGGHYLSCGHTIVGDVTCGSNCKGNATEEEPFNCPQCQDMVKDILKNKFTKEQKEKVKSLRAKNDLLAIPMAVEYSTRHLPSSKGNISQTVMSLLTKGYGRECRDVPREPQPKTLAGLYEEHQGALEQKTRTRLAEDKLDPFNKHQKRKVTTDSIDVPASEGEATLNISKKQKSKLMSHREPIFEANRGIKRAAPEEDDNFSDGETLVDNGSPSPTGKKLRQKLQIHREPFPCHPHGTKRKLSSSEQFANIAQQNKRIMSSFPQVFGEARFMPVPSPGASSTWELERKRKQNEYAHYDGSNKRMRNWEVLPGKDVIIPEVVFGA